MKPGILVAALASLLLFAGVAGATPFTLGTTSDLSPSVAVDPSGDAYVVWSDPTDDTPASGLAVDACEIPAAGTACASLHVLYVNEPYNGNPFVFIGAGGDPVVVIAGRGGGSSGTETAYTSADQGQTWTPDAGASSSIGDLPLDSAAFDPGLGVVFGASTFDPNTGSVAANAGALGAPGTAGQDATLLNVPNGPLSTTTAESDTATAISLVNAWAGPSPTTTTGASYGYYSGPELKGLPPATVLSDVGSSANWTEGSLRDGGTWVSLAGGPSGIFLAETEGTGYPAAYLPSVRKFTGGASGFGTAANAGCTPAAYYGGGVQGQNLYEDPVTGGLSLAYIEASGEGTEYVEYTKLSGSTQSPPTTLYQQTGGANLTDPVLATDGSSHPGLAIWVAGDSVTATWLPAVTLSGCPRTGAPTATTSGRIAGQKLTLTSPAPSACVAAKTLGVTLAAGAAHASQSRGEKFAQTTFSIDRGVKHRITHTVHRHRHTTTVYLPNATVHHLVATETLSLSGLKAGAHTLTVKVSFRRTATGHGRRKAAITTTVTLRAKFTVC